MDPKIYISYIGFHVLTGKLSMLLTSRLDDISGDIYTINARILSVNTINKSDITDHATRENHVLDWYGATVVEKDLDRRKRHVREVIGIR